MDTLPRFAPERTDVVVAGAGAVAEAVAPHPCALQEPRLGTATPCSGAYRHAGLEGDVSSFTATPPIRPERWRPCWRPATWTPSRPPACWLPTGEPGEYEGWSPPPTAPFRPSSRPARRRDQAAIRIAKPASGGDWQAPVRLAGEDRQCNAMGEYY